LLRFDLDGGIKLNFHWDAEGSRQTQSAEHAAKDSCMAMKISPRKTRWLEINQKTREKGRTHWST
jgi:hypothetical protein